MGTALAGSEWARTAMPRHRRLSFRQRKRLHFGLGTAEKPKWICSGRRVTPELGMRFAPISFWKSANRRRRNDDADVIVIMFALQALSPGSFHHMQAGVAARPATAARGGHRIEFRKSPTSIRRSRRVRQLAKPTWEARFRLALAPLTTRA